MKKNVEDLHPTDYQIGDAVIHKGKRGTVFHIPEPGLYYLLMEGARASDPMASATAENLRPDGGSYYSARSGMKIVRPDEPADG